MKKNIDIKQTEEYLLLENQLKKALADYINLEKDIDRKSEMRIMQMKIQIGLEIIQVIDTIELAIKAKESLNLDDASNSWVNGIIATLSQLEKILSTYGIVKMNVNPGDQFDSSVHEGLGAIPGGEKGKIHEVLSFGYMLGEYVVRPARVIIYQGV